MKDLIDRAEAEISRAYEHAQELEIQSTRRNILHLSGCLAALEEALGAIQGISVPDGEVTEDV